MAAPIQGLPAWFPAWLWRAIHTAWFASTALGFAGYEFAALINDVTGAIPWWARAITGVLSGLMVRLGIWLEHRKTVRLNSAVQSISDGY
jgi:hypothetical protein